MGATIALDHNFPQVPLSTYAGAWFPGLTFVPIRKLNTRLAELSDDELVTQLALLGVECLVTQDDFTNSPEALVAIEQTRLTVFIVDGVGHDPIRALGAVLLDFAAAFRRRAPGRGNVFKSRPRGPNSQAPRHYLGIIAARRGVAVGGLYQEHARTEAELSKRLV